MCKQKGQLDEFKKMIDLEREEHETTQDLMRQMMKRWGEDMHSYKDQFQSQSRIEGLSGDLQN